MNLALAEMYVQGISTGKMITVLQKLVGPDISISSTQISRCNATLDEGLEAWRNRPLGNTPYLILDARYERVRYGGQVIDCAVLVALTITLGCVRRVKRCFRRCPGRGASSTCNTMHRNMFQGSIYARAWRAPFVRSLVHPIVMKPSACFIRQSILGVPTIQSSRCGPRRTFPRDWPSSDCPPHIVCACEQPTGWSD